MKKRRRAYYRKLDRDFTSIISNHNGRFPYILSHDEMVTLLGISRFTAGLLIKYGLKYSNTEDDPRYKISDIRSFIYSNDQIPFLNKILIRERLAYYDNYMMNHENKRCNIRED